MKKFLVVLVGIINFYMIIAQTDNSQELQKKILILKNEIKLLKKDTSALNQVNKALKKDTFVLTQDKKALVQDTTFLRTELQAFYSYTKANSGCEISKIDNFEISVLGCKGDRSGQSVTIEFLIKHSLPNQKFYLSFKASGPFNAQAVDLMGNSYTAKSVAMNGLTSNDNWVLTTLPTNVPTKGTITFRNVMPGTDYFKFADFQIQYLNFDGDSNDKVSLVTIKNLKINWD
jgi:hypothetical protein